jgi:hypothetical protein
MGMAGLVHGIPAGKQMGINTWMAFWGSDAGAMVTGQIVVMKGQVQRVLRALRRAGIDVMALQGGMIDEHPEFLRFLLGRRPSGGSGSRSATRSRNSASMRRTRKLRS